MTIAGNSTSGAFSSHFGFEEVEEAKKQEKVNAVFHGVAARYDLMNDLMSGGAHHAWKDALIDRLHPASRMHLLDLAGGTGDIAFRFLDAGGGQVSICDINPAMLEQGRRRAVDRNRSDAIAWVTGNAEALPFPDSHFHACTIAFGIRNVTHIERVLEEAYRVLRPGGQFLCLEFSRPKGVALEKLYDWYSFRVIPLIGEVVARDRESYRYLVESIRQFPDQEAFLEMLQSAGFSHARYTNMTGGVVALHTGWKL